MERRRPRDRDRERLERDSRVRERRIRENERDLDRRVREREREWRSRDLDLLRETLLRDDDRLSRERDRSTTRRLSIILGLSALSLYFIFISATLRSMSLSCNSFIRLVQNSTHSGLKSWVAGSRFSFWSSL